MRHSNIYSNLLLLFIGAVFWQNQLLAYQITGTLHLSDEWERKIYLSIIPSFDDMRTASEELILQIAEVNKDGSFVFQGEGISAKDRMYRIHVCKKGDPAATLFIGGWEENHFHFVMNNDSDLIFQSESLFHNVSMNGHIANELLQQLSEEIKQLRKPPTPNSKVNRELRQQHLRKYLFAFVDSCSNPVVSQLALHHMDLMSIYQERPILIKRKIQEWEKMDAESPYLKGIQQQFTLLQPRQGLSTFSKWLLVGLGLVVIWLIYSMIIKNNEVAAASSKDQSKLSLQERRVFQLLSAGKSNKEISEGLHIEVSTVKSHVSSIYSKLGVRSRKELINGKI